MKTIKIESSFWVGDIVYGIVAKYNKQDKLECSDEEAGSPDDLASWVVHRPALFFDFAY